MNHVWVIALKVSAYEQNLVKSGNFKWLYLRNRTSSGAKIPCQLIPYGKVCAYQVSAKSVTGVHFACWFDVPYGKYCFSSLLELTLPVISTTQYLIFTPLQALLQCHQMSVGCNYHLHLLLYVRQLNVMEYNFRSSIHPGIEVPLRTSKVHTIPRGSIQVKFCVYV